MQKYTKAIIAFFAVLLPFLDQAGAALPEFLTLAWVQGLVLALTPVAVYFFPNKELAKIVVTGVHHPSNSPGNTSANSPTLAGFLAIVLACSMLAGCGIQRPQINSISDAIAVTAADIETSAQLVKNLCLNTVPGGPCAPGAILSTEAKESLKAQLERMLSVLRAADMALSVNENLEAEDRLAQVQALLMILRGELARAQET